MHGDAGVGVVILIEAAAGDVRGALLRVEGGPYARVAEGDASLERARQTKDAPQRDLSVKRVRDEARFFDSGVRGLA